jgi:hypothetical protein
LFFYFQNRGKTKSRGRREGTKRGRAQDRSRKRAQTQTSKVLVLKKIRNMYEFDFYNYHYYYEYKINELKVKELTSFYDFVNELHGKLDNHHKQRRAKAKVKHKLLKTGNKLNDRLNNSIRFELKWERYMKCDGSPDPSNPGEINTFLTLWREDTENTDAASSINNVILALSLIKELEILIEDLESQNLQDTWKQIEQHRHVILVMMRMQCIPHTAINIL